MEAGKTIFKTTEDGKEAAKKIRKKVYPPLDRKNCSAKKWDESVEEAKGKPEEWQNKALINFDTALKNLDSANEVISGIFKGFTDEKRDTKEWLTQNVLNLGAKIVQDQKNEFADTCEKYKQSDGAMHSNRNREDLLMKTILGFDCSEAYAALEEDEGEDGEDGDEAPKHGVSMRDFILSKNKCDQGTGQADIFADFTMEMFGLMFAATEVFLSRTRICEIRLRKDSGTVCPRKNLKTCSAQCMPPAIVLSTKKNKRKKKFPTMLCTERSMTTSKSW
jgi:hypothetical protein